MLHPLVISPKFLMDAKDNDLLLDQFKSFIKQYKEYWRDIFILVDDKNDTLTKEYARIKNEFGHENPDLSIILDYLISVNKTKKINLNILLDEIKIEKILDTLKKNRVNNIVSFPDYFSNEEISLKNTTGKIPFSKMTSDKILDRITSITRFSKNVILIDPMIPYTASNINSNYKYIHNNNLSEVTNNINVFDNDLIFSLNKLIKRIYDTSFFKKDLKINIRTTITESKINHFRYKIINNINIWKLFNSAKEKGHEKFIIYPNKNDKNKFEEYNTLEVDKTLVSLITKNTNENEEQYQSKVKRSKIYKKVMSDDKIKQEINNWDNVGKKIKTDLEKFTSCIVDSLEPTVTINAHFKDRKNEKPGEPVQDIYDRHILALDLDYSYEIRKGLDIFDSKKDQLKNITSWYIKLDSGVFEKSASYYIFSHKLFVPTKINYN